MTQHRLCRLVVIMFLALIGACTQQTKPEGPKFTGHLLLLSGDKTKGADLLDLSATTTGPTNNYLVVTSGVFEAVSSPDHTHLLYTTNDEIMLRDFSSNAVKSLVRGKSFCLAWAPDGNRFSYKQGEEGGPTKLFESDLNGQARTILEDPNGSLDCAVWIAADRLVFDRFVGTQQKTKSGEGVKPNTTTIATITDAVKLHDTQKKWSIESVCAKGNNAFVRAADGGQLLIAKNVDHFETLDPSPVSCSDCRFVGYAAQSCVPFFVEQPTSTTTELFYLNPTNWQKQKPASIHRTFSLNAKMLIKSSAKLMVAGDQASLFLIDTESGEITSLFARPTDNGGSATTTVPIVWIEK